MDEIVPVEGESVNKTLEEEVNSVHVEPTVDDSKYYNTIRTCLLTRPHHGEV